MSIDVYFETREIFVLKCTIRAFFGYEVLFSTEDLMMISNPVSERLFSS